MICLDFNILRTYFSISSIFHFCCFIVFDYSAYKFIIILIKSFKVLEILIQTRAFDAFIVLPQFLNQGFIVLYYRANDLNFGFCYVFLQRFHVKKVQMCVVKVELADLLHGSEQIVGFEIPMEHNIVAHLRDLLEKEIT